MIVIRGHLGFGDCVHQRAIIRTMMEQGETDIVLETFYGAMYHDLVERGLKLRKISGHPPRIKELNTFPSHRISSIAGAAHFKLRYNATTVHQHGSILAAQYACCGMTMPKHPDFSLVVPDAWRKMARKRLGITSTKPLMVYRPLVLNNLFHCDARLPDVESYATLYRSICHDYHVVSVCNLGDYGEHIVGPEMAADTAFHRGELPFEELVGLYAEADLAFTCAGFAPVLAQAVGTRTVVVYGGHEGYKTTNSVGAHLAPTMAIEPANVCECHAGHYTRGVGGGLVKPKKDHECDKTLDVETALTQMHYFLERARAYA